MSSCRIVDLRGKEVINVSDGARLGYPIDVELDQVTGRLCAIVVAEPGGCLGLLGKGPEMVIQWECIRRIGDDIILVDYTRHCDPFPRRKRWFW